MLTLRPEVAAHPTHPLSQAQWAWWLAQQMHPNAPVTVAMYLDIEGAFDVGLAKQCARRAARELESPQLRLCVVDGYPRQYVDSEAQLRFDTLDLTSEANPVAAALDRMECDYSAPLDPLTEELTVAVVFAVAPNRHLLYLRSHHIVLDGVGAAAVLRRTAELYRAAVDAGVAHTAPSTIAGAENQRTISGRTSPPRTSGADGSSAQCGALSVAEMLEDERAYRESARTSADRDYWREQLAELGDPIGVAGRPAAPMTRPHCVTGRLDDATTRLLAQAKARHGATFPELAAAAFGCYLARMTGDAEVTLTMPVTARTTIALRRSAGSMSNVVPLRLTGLDESTIGAVITQVRARVIGALRHQRYRHEDMRRGHMAVLGGFGPVVNLLGSVEPVRLGRTTGQVRLLALGPVADFQINGYQAGPDESSVSVDFQANPARYRYATVVWHHSRFL